MTEIPQVYDSSETRLLVSSAPISRNGILSHLSNALKADLTISGGLHCAFLLLSCACRLISISSLSGFFQ